VGTYYWVVTYSGNTFNNSVTDNGQTQPSEQETTVQATPQLTTQGSETASGVVGSAVLSDTATLSGGFMVAAGSPAPTLTFNLIGPNGSTVYTETQTVTGTGNYTTAGTGTGSDVATQVGTYYWVVTYSGNTFNNSVTDNGQNESNEQESVVPATPQLTTQASESGTVVSSAVISDSATLSGGYMVAAGSPAPTLTFNLIGPNGSTVYTETQTVTGDATYTTKGTGTGSDVATQVGTYYWVVIYSGNTFNNSVTDNGQTQPSEQETTVQATPQLTTQGSETANGVVGTAVLSDSASLSGGYMVAAGSPAPTLTFSLVAPNGSTVYSETQTVTGTGNYTTTGTGSGSDVATQVGTYYWNVSYSGNTFNNSVTHSGVNDTNEQLTTVQSTPSLSTQGSETANGVVGTAVLSDTATLSGGFMVAAGSPAPTITFSLIAPNGSTVYTETQTVIGDTTYTTTGTGSGSDVATQVGTYYWNVSYSGNTLNNSVTHSGVNDSHEQLTTTPATPQLTTQGSETAGGVVGTAVLSDSATLSGGYQVAAGSPAPTLAFTLIAPNGSTVYTETQTVTGDTTYTTTGTGAGSELATQVGTYYWNVSYNANGNTFNNSVTHSGQNDTHEQLTTVSATPSITTTPGGTLSLGMTISGTKYLDLTGNGFSNDDTPQAGVTINLYKESNGSSGLQVGSGGDTFVASTTTTSNGTYSFTVFSSGTYYVQEAVPSGYVQTGGGPNGSAGNTYYTVNVATGQNYSGYNFDDFQIPTCVPTCVSYKVTTPNGCSQTVSSLGGNTQQGDTVTVYFTVPSGMNDTLTLVSYKAPTPYFSDSNAYQQVIYQQATGTFGPGTHSLTVQIPNCYYQIDFVCGQAINELEPNQNNDAYGPDAANILYHAENRFISGDNGGTTAPNLPPASPPPTPTLAQTSSPKLTDSATLSGGSNPGGTITFYLFAPGVTPNANNSNNVYSDTVTVNGNGTYSTASGTNPGGLLPTQAGTYQWVAIYSGDTNNKSVTSSFGSEPETVSGATPSISTTPGGTVVLDSNTPLTDSATLSGGYNPGGTITFYLFAPGVTPNFNYSNNVYCDAVTVNGNGTYTTSAGNNPGGFIPAVTGTFEWVAVYSGDTNNSSVTSPFGSEGEAVITSGAVAAGDFATIGFWHNCNGQAVIDSFNGGSSATQLGNWLASNFPNLFGTSNPYISSTLQQFGKTSLAGLTNAQIATVYSNLWTPSGVTKNTYVQAFAVALGMYADSPSLGYNSTAAGYGFESVSGGGGNLTFNVGSNGAAFGVANNSSLTVYTILSIVNANFDAALGTFFNGNINQQTLTSDLNNVLNGINSKGDIS
jgi:hypothetical protein